MRKNAYLLFFNSWNTISSFCQFRDSQVEPLLEGLCEARHLAN